MNSRIAPFRGPLVLVPALVSLLVLPWRVLPAANPPPPPPPLEAGSLAHVFGPEPWEVKPATAWLSEEPALSCSTPQAIRLETKMPAAAPLEVCLVFRLPPSKVGTNLQLQLACAERPDKTQQALTFNVRALEGQPSLGYTASVTRGKPAPGQTGTQYLLGMTERSLGWPEDLRRIVEAEIAAAPKPETMLHTLRCTVEKGHFRGYLNGRFVTDLSLEEGFNPIGLTRISLPPKAELLTVRTRPLRDAGERFVSLSLAGNLNRSPQKGKEIDATSLPGALEEGWPSRPGNIDQIPFEFAKAALTGEDHLDLGTSSTRFGALPGFFSSNHGPLARWVAADRLDPDRHCLYVPTGRYKALHLIAVAEDRPDTVPIVTAQFYRPNAGHPFNFATRVPSATGEPGRATVVPIKLADGTASRLYHVTVPLDPDAFSWFTDLPKMGLELTKEVHYYRGYPDPLEYSWHGAGLPSSVQIYAATLERAAVDVEITPANFGHVWTAPAKPQYSIELRNRTGVATKATLVDALGDPLGGYRSRVREIQLPASEQPVTASLTLEPERFGAQPYGLHTLVIELQAGAEAMQFKRQFAYLHEDTREHTPWQEGRGSIFGYWPWNGGHDTPKADKEIEIMAAAGAETSTANYSLSPPDIQALAEKHHFISEAAFFGGIMYQTGFVYGTKFEPTKPEEMAQQLLTSMKKNEAKPSSISRPTYVPFFAEPQIGNITTGIWPSHYGEPYELNEAEQAKLESMRERFLVSGRAVRKEWPNLKLLLPYGDPMNTVVFLKKLPETRELIDGVALDLPAFERVPEQQVSQVTLNRLYPIMKDIREHKPNPYLALIEGFCVSSKDIDTGEAGQADLTMRNFLTLMGYGLTRFEAPNSPFDCANYWGENHYGGGWNSRLPLTTPKLAYVNYATMTRHLNRANYTKYVPTGSTSTFCQQFKHYQTGKLIHVLWTVRGQRPVTVKVPAGTTLSVFDGSDNAAAAREQDGRLTFTLTQSPQYLEGLSSDAEMTLGESDHSDSQPGEHARKLANFGDGSWSVSAEVDLDYTKNKPQQIERFPAKMTLHPTEAPAAQGTQALIVHLEPQEKDRGVMPFFTTIVPKQPIVIPGKASHLGVWVHAASDWGRIVYQLRDAKGEKWISVGTREEWNNDDIHCWSAFCFDGWRYLKFQLPSNLPYDSYREHGSSWWGSTGGDGIVDLPLQLEKVMVERRPKVVYGAKLVRAKEDDVLLGALHAEYASPADQTEETVRQSRLRMPLPQDTPELSNPLVDLRANGVGAPTKVLGVSDPAHMYDGSRCHVQFEPVQGAKSYDIWVSPYADGRGAIMLGKAWKEPGQLLQGLRPELEFHLFVTYTDADGKVSQPSAPFPFKLKNRFGYN